MASLDGSTTTVSGKVCTRRLRPTTSTSTSTTSTTAAAQTSSTDATTTTTAEAQQTTVAAASSTVETSTTAAATSAAGTNDGSIPSPAPPQGNAPDGGATVSAAAVVGTTAAAISVVPSSSSTISSDTSIAVDTSIPATTTQGSTTNAGTLTGSAVASTTNGVSQQTSQIVATSAQLTSAQPAQSTATGVSSGSPAGVISPDQGTTGGGDDTLTLGNNNTNVGAIAGGVVGGFAGIAMVSVLLFLCLRRRKTREPFVKWQKRISEKNDGEGNGFMAKLKAIAEPIKDIPEKLRAVPERVGVFVGKLKGRKSGSSQNPYSRQSVRSEVSSVYSVRTNARSRSVSEPASRWKQQLRDFGDRMPSLKKSRALLQPKQDSLVIGAKSPFPGIVENPVGGNSKELENPFADPLTANAPQIPPPALARSTSTKSQRGIVDGLTDQQRAPMALGVVNRSSRETFASLFDEINAQNGSGTPEYLREAAHKRTQSATTALRSHPASVAYTASIYTNAENPFFDPSDAPPVPQQPLPPNPPRRPSNAYAPMPMFNATSSGASRESNGSFLLYGEPGPSRPTTNMYSEIGAAPRIRQSDPFDLDRPEVLRFGLTGQREVRASVTRQNSKRSNRASSVSGWGALDSMRGSAIPGPLRTPSTKRR